ncbi:MAG: type II secretion system F family protein [Verrucomicrobiae bacterium]|nr:type II secretion system F family protein [Verrucomicrobiae bacterium]
MTPSRLSRLAEFYHQLGTMLAAGMTLLQSLDRLRMAPPAGFLRLPLQRILDSLNQGSSLAEALTKLGKWLPAFDLALLKAGELSGHLDTVCKLLAGYYDERAQMARQLLADLSLPLFILHAAVFLAPLPAFVLGGTLTTYFRETIGMLAPFYLLTLLMLWACQGTRSATWRALVDSLLHRLPILGKARRHLALARLAKALEILLSAGVPITEAWLLAANASGSAALQRAVQNFPDRIQAGQTPSELLRSLREFPAMFTNLYETGELSGTLDDTLKRLFAYYRDDAARKMKTLAEWTPRVVYLVIVAVLAFQIVSFWAHFADSLSKE